MNSEPYLYCGRQTHLEAQLDYSCLTQIYLKSVNSRRVSAVAVLARREGCEKLFVQSEQSKLVITDPVAGLLEVCKA